MGDNPVKIAYMTDLQNAAGGGGTNAHRLCAAFDRRDDVDVVAVHAQGTDAPENFWTDEMEYTALYPRSFRNGIEAVDPDIVFVHGFNVDMLQYLKDMKTTGTDRVFAFRNGVNVLEQWLNLPKRGKPDEVTAPVYDLDVFDAVFAPSHAAAERLKFHYGSDVPAMAIAPCTVEYDDYVPTPFMEDDTLKVVTASRIAPNNYVLAPVLAVRRLIEDYDVEMKILGAGDPPYPTIIEQIVGGIPEVEIVGYQQPEAVRPYLQESDVVCVPSISQQAVPTVAVEAMAAGNVVLSGGYQTAVEEETIVTVPVDHIPRWYEALEDVATSPDDANGYIREGLDAAKGYDTDYVVDEAYIPMFKMLMEDTSE